MFTVPRARRSLSAAGFAVLTLGLAGLTFGQATRPAGPATLPAGQDRSARVQKVEGKVSFSVLKADGTFGEWQPVRPGDSLAPGTRIRTGIRSRVILIFGENTVVLIDRATLASIDQFRETGDGQQIALGLGHGAVRAGAAETTLRSDMIIQTPTATLSKRGTFGIELEYEPSTGYFRAALSDSGLINILNRLTGQDRTVAPGQYVTQAMTRWIEVAKFSGWVNVNDAVGLTPGEQVFNAFYNTGPGVAQPGAGTMANVTTAHQSGDLSGATLQGRMATMPPVLAPPGAGVLRITRNEGNFGARR
ncbi:MAG: hypothetical protein AMXMBFR83_04490 [Phycisphaerae bacterium]